MIRGLDKVAETLRELKKKALITSLFDSEVTVSLANDTNILFHIFVFLPTITELTEKPKDFVLQVYYRPIDGYQEYLQQQAYYWSVHWSNFFSRLFGVGLSNKYNAIRQIPKKYVSTNTVHEYFVQQMSTVLEKSEQISSIPYEPVIVIGTGFYPQASIESRIRHINQSVNWQIHLAKIKSKEYRLVLQTWRSLVYLVSESSDGRRHWTVEGYYIPPKHRDTLWQLKTYVIPERYGYLSRRTFYEVYGTSNIFTGGYIMDRTRYLIPLFHVFTKKDISQTDNA